MSLLRSRLPLSMLVMLGLTACASGVGHYVPDIRVDGDEIQPFPDAGAIQFENRSPGGLRNLDFREIEVDLNEVTQALINAMSVALGQQSDTARDGIAKTITLNMKGIIIEPEGGGLTFASTVFIDVAMGDGESFFVESKRSSYGSAFNVVSNPTKPLDAAVSDAAALILNDPRLRAYVE
ncbi:MAG: hypothetical protein OEV34_16055 [Gammaproteobacteria bacterium]|nr:hypothetical protein [Gammaproteobacteria bacterium]MDH3990647.1 hypothetical protein [Gammaproteobacteria bacterium]